MKNVALVVGLLLVLVVGAVLGTACANGGGGAPATTMAAALASTTTVPTTATTTTTTTCPANPGTYTVAFVLTKPGTLTYPGPQRVYPCEKVVWTLENKCQQCGKTKVKIQGRRLRHKTACGQGVTVNDPEDCFKKNSGGQDCKPENGVHAEYGQPAQTIGECTIKDASTLLNGCFKYDLDVKPQSTAHFPVDPEIEVQGGNPLEELGPKPAPSTTTPGSPSPRVSPAP